LTIVGGESKVKAKAKQKEVNKTNLLKQDEIKQKQIETNKKQSFESI